LKVRELYNGHRSAVRSKSRPSRGEGGPSGYSRWEPRPIVGSARGPKAGEQDRSSGHGNRRRCDVEDHAQNPLSDTDSKSQAILQTKGPNQPGVPGQCQRVGIAHVRATRLLANYLQFPVPNPTPLSQMVHTSLLQSKTLWHVPEHGSNRSW
jgi:hypothetical protein